MAQVFTSTRSAASATPAGCQPARVRASPIRWESDSFIWQPNVWMKKLRATGARVWQSDRVASTPSVFLFLSRPPPRPGVVDRDALLTDAPADLRLFAEPVARDDAIDLGGVRPRPCRHRHPAPRVGAREASGALVGPGVSPPG